MDMYFWNFKFAAICLFIFTDSHFCQNISHEGRLLNDLFSSYDSRVRPSHTPTNVFIVVDMKKLVTIDQNEQFLSGHFGVLLVWSDARLTWNTSAYGGISEIIVDYTSIWTPDIIIRNELGNKRGFEDMSDKTVTIYSFGLIFLQRQKNINVGCTVDVLKFPFDEHNCSISVGPSHATTKQLIVFDNSASINGISTYLFQENSEWEFINTSVKRNDQILRGVTFPELKYELHFRRRSLDFIVSFLVPIVILSFLNLLCYHIPIESGEKLNVCMISFLTFAVFVSFMSEILPRHSIRILRINVYLVVQFAISGFNIIAQAFVLHVYYSNDQNMSCIRKILLKLCSLFKLKRSESFDVSLNSEEGSITKSTAKENANKDAISDIQCENNYNCLVNFAIKFDRCLGVFAFLLNIASLVTYLVLALG